ncbi:unnamed protein product, partial [Ixodes hexagonus]
ELTGHNQRLNDYRDRVNGFSNGKFARRSRRNSIRGRRVCFSE